MKLTRAERDVLYRRRLIELLLKDSERQLSANAATSSALGTRAAILIASASIATGLQVVRNAEAGWYLLALTATALAALAGVVVVLPRRGREVDPRDVENSAWNDTDTEVTRRLLYSRLAILDRDKSASRWRALVLVIGFAALLVGVVGR